MRAFRAGCLFLLILGTGAARRPAAVPQEPALTVSAEGVRIGFPAGRRSSALRVLRVFPEVRAAVRSLTGAPLENPVTIELLDDHESMVSRVSEIGGEPPDEWIDGLAFPQRRLILLRLDARGSAWHRVEGLLTHEMAHVAVHEFRGAPGASPIPRWLDEGIAQYAEGRPLTELFWHLSLHARLGLLIPLTEMDEAFLETGGRRAKAYVQAESFVRFLARSGGGRRFVKSLLADLRSGTGLDLAVTRHSFFGLEAQEARWHEALERDIGATLRSIAPLSFAVFIGFASIVILIRRDRRRRRLEEKWAREEIEEAGDA